MTAPPSMTERIAQVIDPNAFAGLSGPHWDGRKNYALAKAREILEAAHEPTEAMLNACDSMTDDAASPYDHWAHDDRSGPRRVNPKRRTQ